MWVVKLGGSLCRSPMLTMWLEVLASYGGGRVVIVPGGGRFADQVLESQEQWGFDDGTAHRMALLAMDQYGLMLCGIRPDLRVARSDQAVRLALLRAAVPVWLPFDQISGNPDVPESWDVTSDSLAAWLAAKLGATRLFLVKSWQPEGHQQSATDLCVAGIVDSLFPSYVANAPFDVHLLGPSDFEPMRRALLSDVPAGMRVVA